MDRGLAEGLVEYEASILSHGIPAWDALDEDMDGHFEAEMVTDQAQAVLDRAHAEHKDPEPGTRYRVVDTRNRPPEPDPEPPHDP